MILIICSLVLNVSCELFKCVKSYFVLFIFELYFFVYFLRLVRRQQTTKGGTKKWIILAL